MQHRTLFRKLNQQGFDHIVVALVCMVGAALIGTYALVASHASPWRGVLEMGKQGSLNSSYCLTATSGSIGAAVVLNPCSTTVNNNQIWTLNDARTATLWGKKNVQEFTLQSAAGSNLCLNNWGMSKQQVYPEKLYTCSNSDNGVLWVWGTKFTGLGYSPHQLTNIASGTSASNNFCLDDQYGSYASGTNVGQYTCTLKSGQWNQEWFEASAPTGSNPSGGGGSTSGSGTITAGDSKANCITLPNGPNGDVNQTALDAIQKTTGFAYNCLETFANPMPTWTEWQAPWQFSNGSSWSNWLAASPSHQMILGVDLIPQSAPGASNVDGVTSNPLAWEQECDAGNYNTYATQLASYLVAHGGGHTVIRLGIEANGSWEADYVGTSSTEMTDWAKCYDSEVTAMRKVSGANFLFVWNPNICTRDLTMDNWYPGDSYVDIIGADAYDSDCHFSSLTTVSQEGWQAYYTDSASYPDASFPSLQNIEAFSQTHNKPMSFPEWGLNDGGPDDDTYVTDMGQMFKGNEFAFESYFNVGDDGITPLGTAMPKSTAAYTQTFK